jgi:plastocyanin
MRRFRSTALALGVVTMVSCGDNVREEMAESAVSEAMIPQPVDTVQAAALADELVDGLISEYKIELDRDTITAGQITFRVRNTGQLEHAFEIEGQDQEWKVDHIMPGVEKVLTAELTPGSYTIYCPVEDEHGKHADLGMRMTILVR